jgi:hypothetical protein
MVPLLTEQDLTAVVPVDTPEAEVAVEVEVEVEVEPEAGIVPVPC